MRKQKRKRNHSEINFWQSNTDLMTAICLVLMLIIMLLVLYLSQLPEFGDEDKPGDSYAWDNVLGDTIETESEDKDDGDGDGDGDEETEETEEHDDDDGGGGGGEGTVGDDPDLHYEYPFPTQSGDDWSKSAVFATVIDAETGRAIQEPGLTFEFYEEQQKGDGGALRSLNTYYPVKVEYRTFETTEKGVFYLPEKIEKGHYYFKQITGLEGYDLAEATYFDIDDSYDWPEPYVVSIGISPSKNIIPIVLEDLETNEPVTGGDFKVNAAEDIVTADQSVRYRKSALADTIVLAEDGTGESKELYLGKYTVAQGEIPQYYASVTESKNVRVEQKDGNRPPEIKFVCEKTKIRVRLTDEIYPNIQLEGAEFALVCEKNPEFSQKAVTDKNGAILFTNLEKGQTYTLEQKSAPENYKYDGGKTDIFVDKYGRIEGGAEAQYDLTNYVVRVQIGAKDALFGNPVSNVNMALYDSNDVLIRTWTTSGSEEIFENPKPGAYYIVVDGKKDKKHPVEFNDETAMQEFAVGIWTMGDIASAAAAGVAALAGLCMVNVVMKKRKRKKGTEA